MCKMAYRKAWYTFPASPLIPVDDGDEGEGGHEASLNGSLLETHQANHQQLEDEDGHNYLIKCLLPYLHNIR